ncbi:MAG: aromatic amino acid lyase, partial [Thermomicrobium sp.]
MQTLWLGRDALRIGDLVAVAQGPARVEVRLAPEAAERLRKKRSILDRLSDADRPVYGVTTGFGALAQTWIPETARRTLQQALLRSHAAGIGPPLPHSFVRAMMVARANSLAQGYSGVRPEVVERLLQLVARDVIPYVPRYGSLGASGDLAPLAHIALCLTGEGWVLGADWQRRSAAEVLAAAAIEPLQLDTKEGLALVNGTDGMVALLALAHHRA